MEDIQPPPLRGDGAYEYDDTNPDHLIGRSKFGYVFRAKRKLDQKIVALTISRQKLSHLNEEENQNLFEEIKLMKKLTHRFIVKILDDYIDSDEHQCIVHELYTEGDFK
jgi:serine/threonine protein kinase